MKDGWDGMMRKIRLGGFIQNFTRFIYRLPERCRQIFYRYHINPAISNSLNIKYSLKKIFIA